MLICAGGQNIVTRGVQGESGHWAIVHAQDGGRAGVGDVPDTNSGVVGASDYNVLCGVEHYSVDLLGVSLQHSHDLLQVLVEHRGVLVSPSSENLSRVRRADINRQNSRNRSRMQTLEKIIKTQC